MSRRPRPRPFPAGGDYLHSPHTWWLTHQPLEGTAPGAPNTQGCLLSKSTSPTPASQPAQGPQSPRGHTVRPRSLGGHTVSPLAAVTCSAALVAIEESSCPVDLCPLQLAQSKTRRAFFFQMQSFPALPSNKLWCRYLGRGRNVEKASSPANCRPFAGKAQALGYTLVCVVDSIRTRGRLPPPLGPQV